MTISAINAHAFYDEVCEACCVWGIQDDSGFPAPVNSDGQRAMPFFSSEKRALSLIARSKSYTAFSPAPILLTDFLKNWLPGLARDGLLVGINWTGDRASGYDILPAECTKNIETRIKQKGG